METAIEAIAKAQAALHALSLSLVSDDYEARVSAYYELGDIADALKAVQIVEGFRL